MPANPSPDEYAVSAALEAERRRLATRLQTTLIGQINLVLAQINAYEQNASGPSQQQLAVLSALVRQLLQQAHDLEASLNPTVLETLGLEPALESLTNQHRRSSGVSIALSLPHLRERPPAHIELALFRATQAAIERAVTQGRASHIDTQLVRTENGVRVTIADNGASPANDVLRSTRQRLSRLGGHMAIAANRGGGLTITIDFQTEAPVDLTEREMAVIQLLAEGLTNPEIAAMLEVRPRTIKFHLDNIYSKLGVNTRTAAAIYALRQGWVQRHPPA